MQSSCLEIEERRIVEGKRMQSSCLELEERGRVEGTRDARDSLYQTSDARDYIRKRMQETISDRGCNRLYIRHRM